MTHLVNITPADRTEPVYVDATQLTAIAREGDTTYGFSADGHFTLALDDLAAAAAVLKQAGHDFLALRGRNPNDTAETVLVAPGAITFVSVSQPDKNRNVGVIFGVKGLGRHDISMPESEWYAILAILQNSSRPLFSYTHEQAYARWTRPQELHIYPDSITRIHGDSARKQLNVSFEGSGTLDIQVATSEQEQDLLQERYQAWCRKNPGLDINDEKIFGPASRQLEAEVKHELHGRRALLAHQLALSCGKLVVVKDGKDTASDTQGPVYLLPADVGVVYFGQNGNADSQKYYLHFAQAKNQNALAPQLTAYFNDSAKRDAAFAGLQQQLAARHAAAQKKLKK